MELPPAIDIAGTTPESFLAAWELVFQTATLAPMFYGARGSYRHGKYALPLRLLLVYEIRAPFQDKSFNTLSLQ
jgi:hypothetical protein